MSPHEKHLPSTPTTTTTTAATNKKFYSSHQPPPPYHIRPFDPKIDQTSLEKLCQNVFGGTDYLPSIAPSLASDSKCSVCVLFGPKSDDDDDDDEVVMLSVAYIRQFENQKKHEDGTTGWLGGVRTSPMYRAKGYATMLLRSMVDEEIFVVDDEGNSKKKKRWDLILSTTIKSNVGMRKIFDSLGMHGSVTSTKERGDGNGADADECCVINILDFKILRSLPGWGKNDTKSIQKPLIEALGLQEYSLHQEKDNNKWMEVKSQEELEDTIHQIHSVGGSGYIPGLWRFVGTREVEVVDALQCGRVWKLTNHVRGEEACCFVMIKDDRIRSLHSHWICCICATDSKSVEMALQMACSDRVLDKLDDGCVAFAVAIDGAVNVNDRLGSLCSLLPFASDSCLVYTV